MKAMDILKTIIYRLGFIIILTYIFNACVGNDDYLTSTVPPEGFFKETFDAVQEIDKRPKISDARGFDNGEGIVYSSPSGRADIRTSGTSFPSPFLWLPSKTDASLIIENLPTQGRKNMILKYKFNANIFNIGEEANTHDLTIKCNDVEVEVPSRELNFFNNRNRYIPVRVSIPEGTNKIEFLGTSEKNTRGFRIDDIEIVENL